MYQKKKEKIEIVIEGKYFEISKIDLLDINVDRNLSGNSIHNGEIKKN